MFTSCGSNSYEVSKAIIQAKMLSGRYRTDKLLRHFDNTKSGNCLTCGSDVEGSIEHLLLECPVLSTTRDTLYSMLSGRSDLSTQTQLLINNILVSSPASDIVQLLLDCSAVPSVISTQQHSDNTLCEVFKFTRSWCYSIHVTRMRIAKLNDQSK